MNRQYILGLLFIGFCFSASAAEKIMRPPSNAYEVDSSTLSLKISWADGSRVINGVVGDKGEVTRTLVDFNGTKALHYENLASSTPFEAYFTIARLGGDVVIDCIYANVRNGRNGILINKAVCGLNKPLTEDYDEAIYEFTDEWKNSTGNIAIASLIKTPPSPVRVEEAQFKDIHLVRVYASQEDLVSKVPAAVIQKGKKQHQFDAAAVFSVYKANDLSSPVYVDVVSKDVESPFKRYNYDGLNTLLVK